MKVQNKMIDVDKDGKRNDKSNSIQGKVTIESTIYSSKHKKCKVEHLNEEKE